MLCGGTISPVCRSRAKSGLKEALFLALAVDEEEAGLMGVGRLKAPLAGGGGDGSAAVEVLMVRVVVMVAAMPVDGGRKHKEPVLTLLIAVVVVGVDGGTMERGCLLAGRCGRRRGGCSAG